MNSYGLLLIDTLVLSHQPKKNINPFCVDTGCSLEDLADAIVYRDRWCERERERERECVCV